MTDDAKPQGSESADKLRRALEEAVEHLQLLDLMEAQRLPDDLDQDARDLHRFIQDHAWRYKGSEFSDMSMRLTRSLAHLVCAASSNDPTPLEEP